MPFIELRGITKSYGGTLALADLDLELREGEVHAICGENGAGKSTLNRILAGLISPDSGEILINGRAKCFGSVADAEATGISIVHQESAAFLDLDGVENHQIMHEPGAWWLNRKAMSQRSAASLAELGEAFPLSRPLEDCSVAERQMIAIGRAVACNCRLLILDEPTSSLSSREAQALFATVQSLKSKGTAILYVSHRLEEIFELADRVTVLRDGRWVTTDLVSETSPKELVTAMVGRDVEFQRRDPAPKGEVVLEVRGLQTGIVRDCSFQVSAGEVLGIGGLIGAGRSEIARALFGLEKPEKGVLLVGGIPLKPGVGNAIQSGIALVPEDRQHEGLNLEFPIQENLVMAFRPGDAQWIDHQKESTVATRVIQELDIRCSSAEAAVQSLSGGNQQKVLLGKWLSENPKVLILDEPTRGVDVGAKDQIHRLIDDLAKKGVAIIVISSELNELIALSDRILVMRQGEVAGELKELDRTSERVLEIALPTETAVRSKSASRAIRREWSVLALLAGLMVVSGLVNPAFLGFDNLRDMAVKVAPVIIAASFATLVILAREIDISVGSLMGLCGAVLGVAASTDRLGLSPVVAGALCIGVGLAGGLINGVLVAYARIPSIIVTLGTLTLFRGVTELVLGGKWIENVPPGLRFLGSGSWGGVPLVAGMAVICVLIAAWILRRTRFGLRTYALGSNPQAAKLVGIQETKIRLAIFALAGLAASIAALFSATQLQVIESGFGSGFELTVIASVVVGGTSIRGGRGTVIGTVIGAVLLGIISTALIFLKLGESATYWERAIQGTVILLAILADFLAGKRK